MKLIARKEYKDYFKDKKPTIKELLGGYDKLSLIKDLMEFMGGVKDKELNPLVNNQTTLRLIEYVMSFDEVTNKIKDDEGYETALIKAYLIISDELNSNEKPAFHPEKLSKLSQARFLIPISINQYELDGIDPKVRLNSELAKIALLQRYFNENPHLQSLDSLFFEKFRIENWKEYFFKIMRFIFASMEAKRDSFIVKLDPFTEEDMNFYKTIELIDADIEEYSDFLEIRKRPIIRLNNDEFGVLYLPFVFDKIYKSVYFELSKLGMDNKGLLGSLGQDFQSHFGKDFFEDTLCKNIIERAYKGKSYFKCIEEKDLGNLTDYYVRYDKKIFLFEFKNATIPLKAKCSNDFEIIEKSLLDKLDESIDSRGKAKPRAIKQLITCIRAIFEKESGFSFTKADSFLEEKTPVVYPIIVVQDYCLNAMGINYFLNETFKSKLETTGLKDEYDKQRIKNLTIIHIDYLIYLNDVLKDGIIKLHDLIDEYHRYTNNGKFGNPVSFGQFLAKYVNNKKGFNTKPDIWKEYLQEFIDN
jgi:hypothetical protein